LPGAPPLENGNPLLAAISFAFAPDQITCRAAMRNPRDDFALTGI